MGRLVQTLVEALVEVVQALILKGELLELNLETRHLLDHRLLDNYSRQRLLSVGEAAMNEGRRGVWAMPALPVPVPLLFPKLVVAA
eukprot:scaffold23565_cov71-Phaeocystis_antarctica.AAC.4